MMLARSSGQASRKNRTAAEPKTSFPKSWHGFFVITAGTILALLDGAGLLGLPHGKGDLADLARAISFFLAGLLFGFVLIVWSQFNRP
jgi:hypothetical protein